MKKKITNEEFIERCREVHGGFYIYDRTVYNGMDKKVLIECPIHGLFEQRAYNHLKGIGCPKCKSEKLKILKTSNTDEFIRKAKNVHGNRYTYEKTVYMNAKAPVIITCREHGDFEQKPEKHLRGHGCPKCGNEKMKELEYTRDEIIDMFNKVHGDRYDYSEFSYNGWKNGSVILCKEHGTFIQTPEVHIKGCGCPKCGKRYGKIEEELSTFLTDNGYTVVNCDKSVLNGKEIDLFIPDFKIGFEYDGLEWHSEKYGKDERYHLQKTEDCLNKNVKLFHIFEDEYLERGEIVRKKMLHLLGADTYKKTIGGRNTEICAINVNVAKHFLEEYHIQGYGKGSVHIAASTKDGEIVGVMSFLCNSKKEGKWELTRFATNYNYRCPGVGNKIFSWFVKTFSPTEVKSFADRRWTVDCDNNLYIKMGFKLDKVLRPDYRYVVGHKRKHKFNFRKERLVKKYGLSSELTEKEMCKKLNFYRIWDCGLYRYVWKKNC